MSRPEPPAGQNPRPNGPAAGKWAVRSQTIGEVLTTDIQGNGLRVLVFCTPSKLDSADLEARVGRLADSALDAASRESSPRPVPHLLHHTMREVLALLQELERGGAHPAGAVAFYGNDLEVSFARVGGEEPTLTGLPAGTAPWIRLRYDEGGETASREVHGFSLFARDRLDIGLRWACPLGPESRQGVEVLARWDGSADVAISMRNLGSTEESVPVGPGAPSEANFFAGWFDDLEAEGDNLPTPEAFDPKAPAAVPGGTEGKTWAWPPEFGDLDTEETEDHAQPVAEVQAAPSPVSDDAEELVGVGAGGDDVPWVDPATPYASGSRPRHSAALSFGRDDSGGFGWRSASPWIIAALAIFGFGAWIGLRHTPETGASRTKTASLGFGAPRFTVRVTSDPQGAGIVVNDEPTPLRTPAEIELKPGTHRIAVGDAESGFATYDIEGARGKVNLHAALEGSLQVDGPMADSVRVFVDGELKGRAPLLVSGLAPGLHEVEIAPLGQPARLQTVRVPTRGTARINATPLELPPTGVMEVRCIMADGEGSGDVRGAAVFINGERRGSTPLTVELPRGPHSVRVVHGSEESTIQVIDLPGGNVRYANFTLGTGLAPIKIELPLTGPVPPVMVVASIPELHRKDVREMWLHVRNRQGLWQRYRMKIGVGSRGPEGVAPFPADQRSGTAWYVSALGPTGDEYFTEIQGRSLPRPQVKAKSRAIPQAVIKPDTSFPVVTETPTP